MRWSEPVLLAAAAFALSFVATAWAQAHAHRRGLLDLPGERRSHELPTPRGGGIGIAVAGLCTCGWLAVTGGGEWAWTGIGLALVAAAGWWDDHRPLPAWPRLLAHIAAGACLAAGALHAEATLTVAVAAFLLVPVLVNVWNFIDGIDGLAASQALLAGLAFAWLLEAQGAGLALALTLVGACAGFLPFNLPRARIFLGDVGSGSLGYLLAVLVVTALPSRPLGDWPILLLPLAACVVDAGLTLAVRLMRGEPWWQPHVQHLYQRMARRCGHPLASLAYAGWTALSIGIMLVLYRVPDGWARAGVAVFFVMSMAAWLRLQRRLGKGIEGIG